MVSCGDVWGMDGTTSRNAHPLAVCICSWYISQCTKTKKNSQQGTGYSYMESVANVALTVYSDLPCFFF